MILVTAETRLFPLTEIKYQQAEIDDLFEFLLQIKRANCPNWTDESAADFGIQLAWMFCVLHKWTVDNMERLASDCFIGSTANRESMRRLGELFLYDIAEAHAAEVSVTFNLSSGHPQFTIPKGTKTTSLESVDQTYVTFEVKQDTLVTSGLTSINVACWEGETKENEVVGSSESLTNQVFSLTNRNVIWHSETIEVFDGATWEAWTRVDDFSASTANSPHYRVTADDTGTYYIIFRDGVYGKIPIRGQSNIRATYRVGGGTRGNVGAGTITQLISPVNNVTSVNNASAAVGGRDRETVDHARVASRAKIRSLERAVHESDYEYLADNFVSPNYGSIAVSKAINPGGSMVQVIIVPLSGGLPAEGHKAELQQYLDSMNEMCTSVSVIDPIYRPVDVTVTIYAKAGHGATTVESNVRNALTSILSPTYRDPDTGLFPNKIGRSIYLSDLYRAIMQAEGVNYCVITSPTSDLILTSERCPTVGTLTISVMSS